MTEMLKQLAGDHDRFAVVDVETTGFSPKYSNILEVAVLTLDLEGNQTDLWSSLVKPKPHKQPIRNSYIHGITAEMVADAPSFEGISGKTLERLTGARIVGHNTSFDLRMLSAHFGFGKIGEPTSVIWSEDKDGNKTEQEILPPPWDAYLDTRHIFKGKLVEACKKFNIPAAEHHRAEADALSTAALFLKHPERCSLLPRDQSSMRKQLHWEEEDKEWLALVGSFSNESLAGKRIVITGAVRFVRSKVEQLISQAGGVPVSSVSKKTDFLVVGDIGPRKGTVKIDKAKSLGIEMVSGEDFIQSLLDDAI